MQEFSPNDLTRRLVEADDKFGKFEPDPSDQFVQRYIFAKTELEKVQSWLKQEIDQAWEDDQPARTHKLRLLEAYHARPSDKDQIITFPLVRRAVRRNVAYAKKLIIDQTPLVTAEPHSNESIEVLVEDKQFGPVPLEKSSEEMAQAFEWWLDYKLRTKLNVARVIKTAIKEAKRGQTPTFIKVAHQKEFRRIKTPKFEKKGAIGVTFSSKDELEVAAGEPTRLLNISTYSCLRPKDERDIQSSRWFAESIPATNEEVRARLYNKDYFLVPKDEWEEIIKASEDGLVPTDQNKAQNPKAITSCPKDRHDIWEVYFFWTVPMKQTVVSMDEETGESKEKTTTINQEHSFVGHFHRRLGRLMSAAKIPFDHGMRPYIDFYDEEETFTEGGDSVADDALPYQQVIGQLESLEIRGGVVATTPVFYVEPGSMAGEWLTENPVVEPGSIIPRQRESEIEAETLGDRGVSLLGLVEHNYQQYEREMRLGDMQLGLDVPGRTPASTIAQVLQEGDTEASEFVDTFCDKFAKVIEMYVLTVQQYMRTGEVIPFDPETKALVQAALGEGQDAGAGVPIRFPMKPVTDYFSFRMTASSKETQQADFEKLVALKQIVSQDGAEMAQIIGPLASGQLPPTITEALVQHFSRSEKLMADIAKSIRKDGDKFAISPNLIKAIVEEQKMMQQQIGAANAQGTGPVDGGGVPAVPDNGGGVGQPVPDPGIPPGPVGDEVPPPPPPV